MSEQQRNPKDERNEPKHPAGAEEPAGAPGAQDALRRLAEGALVGLVAASIVAAYEAVRVPSTAPFALLLSSFGLMAPFAIGLGALAAAAGVVLARRDALGVLAVLAWDRSPDAERRSIAARVLLLAPALLVVLVAGARISLDGLLAPPAARAPLASAALAVGASFLVAFGAALGVAPALARRLPGALRPSLALVLALGVVVFGVGALVSFGETSGAGGAFRMFGVFRRDELDLGLVTRVGFIALLAYQLPAFLRKLPTLLVALLLPIGLLPSWGAASWLEDTELSLEIERHAPLSKLGLARARVLFDADGDGFARNFGGGDCDDTAAGINPMADDLPGNGIDEDCSGSDLSPVAPSPSTTAEGTASAGGAAEGTPRAEGSAAAAQALPKNPNVVMITVDTLRYDIGFTGYPRKITPNIDALAARSTYYDRAYALASYTSKSMGPMLIGRYGSETHRGKLHFSIYQPIDKMLQERLQAASIRTVSVQAHWYFKPNTGLGRGFDVLDMSASPEERQGEGDRTITSGDISDAAIRQLRDPANTDKPFFMWIHYLDPHAEYVPHEGFDFGKEPRDLYDGEVAFTDHHVGRVLAEIEQSSFADRTIVILTSDHGESFGEHGMMRHGFELWDVLVRVPLSIYVPGVAPQRVAERRSLIDIAPTVLEALGVEAPKPDARDALRGTSLLRDVLAPPGSQHERRVVFMDMPGGPFVHERQAYIEDDLKLITSRLRPMGLYDLAKDPGELENLVRDTQRTKAALERMKQFRSRLQRVEEGG